MTTSPLRTAAATVIAAVLLLTGCTSVAGALPTASVTAQPSAPATAPAPAPSTPSAAPGTAASLLATLPVKGKAPGTGYQRTADFGAAWLDVDHNGCDTRDDILARDLTGVVRRGSCTVLSGTLADHYTGRTIHFVRGATTSTLVQIDHVVPLQNAWITGAQQLTQEQRTRLANDPLNLLAVDGRSNQQKSAGDAATWLPSNKGFRCEYVARQISVKAAYGLWVTQPEHDAMLRILQTCPARPAVTQTSPARNALETPAP